MLIGDFCTTSQPTLKEDTVITRLKWNESHAIFKGHFPGQPVVPGVCMIQLVMEVLETALGKRLQLLRSDNIKFLHFIDPGVHQDVDMQIRFTHPDEKSLSVSASLQKDDLTFFRFQGNYLRIGA